MWIDSNMCDGDIEIGYLICTLDDNAGRERYSLRDRPAQTNLSHEEKLRGWCGSTNNWSLWAKGVARVVERNQNRSRARVERVTGEALRAFLDADGHPELMPSI